jgi:hypothetical protein
VWRYFPTPAILQVPRRLLHLAPAATDTDRRDVSDGDLNLSVGFNIERLRY